MPSGMVASSLCPRTVIDVTVKSLGAKLRGKRLTDKYGSR